MLVSLTSMIILAVLGGFELNKVNKNTLNIYKNSVVPLERLKLIADDYAVLIVDTTHQARNKNISSTQCVENIKNGLKHIEEEWKIFKSGNLTSKEKNLVSQVENLMLKGDKLSKEIITACKNKDFEALDEITINKLYPTIDPISEKISSLLKFQLKVAEEELIKAKSTYENGIIAAITNVIISAVILIIISRLIINDILKKLNLFRNGLNSFFLFLNKEADDSEEIKVKSKDEFGEMTDIVNKNIQKVKINLKEERELIDETIEVLGKFEKGDLSLRLKSTVRNPVMNELKDVVNTMANNLQKNINNILIVLNDFTEYDYRRKVETTNIDAELLSLAQGVNSLGESITELLIENKSNGLTLDKSSNVLLENVDKLNTSSNEAAASLEQTAAALEEITSTIRNNSEHITQMSKLSNEVNNSTVSGKKLANQTAESMEDINIRVNNINEAIIVIDQIAFQTNILSLNAAVEAATAGEAGKGFAVVAQEVRNLATRSAEAANEIKKLVEEATQKTNEGKLVSDKMIEGFNKLDENVIETTKIISNVETSSKEQLHGIEQINDAVSLLDNQTQQNANISSQTHDVAVTTDKIAKLVVSNAEEKEFIGKNEVKAKDI